jgi:hypothetical protein
MLTPSLNALPLRMQRDLAEASKRLAKEIHPTAPAQAEEVARAIAQHDELLHDAVMFNVCGMLRGIIRAGGGGA